jgi:NAD(P)-dependent dehydrogenase (short-subunit alcohol dehydrogenase family)
MSTLFNLSGETAVVIGATGVLGGALADGLASAGAKVAVLGRNAERGQARVKIIQNAGEYPTPLGENLWFQRVTSFGGNVSC